MAGAFLFFVFEVVASASLEIDDDRLYLRRFRSGFDKSALERRPGAYGEDCTQFLMQARPGGTGWRTWALVPGYQRSASRQCGDPCAYKDTTGESVGVFCIPRDSTVDNNSCCAVSVSHKLNQTQQTDCSVEAKKYKQGDEQLPQCKWGYGEDNGPRTWNNWWPACRGSAQSPIDIQLDKVEKTEAEGFVFEGYDIPIHGQLNDNGHSLVFKDNPEHPTIHSISGGHFPPGVKYRLVQVHWHWGFNNSVGSEHLVDGVRYPMEIHMVHYNEKYQNEDEAFLHPDGVAVNAFFYKLSENDNPGLSELTSFITKLAGMEPDHPIEANADIKFADFLPIHLDHKYVYYNGSFTTPPCSQVVTWTVFNTTEDISPAQLDILRTLKNAEGSSLGNVFRPIQQLNGRKVSASKYY